MSDTNSRFVGNELVAVAIGIDTNELTVQRLVQRRQEQVIFEIEEGQDWSNLRISPNGQYLLAFGLEDEIYTMNLETGESYLLGDGQFNMIDWIPNQDATLGYLVDEDEGVFSLEEIQPDSNQEIEANYPLTISPGGRYAIYKVKDSVNPDFSTIELLDTETAEQTIFGLMSSYSSDVQWLSDSEFVYRHSYVEDNVLSPTDIYFYNAETGENRQLTDTPELEERFNCFAG